MNLPLSARYHTPPVVLTAAAVALLAAPLPSARAGMKGEEVMPPKLEEQKNLGLSKVYAEGSYTFEGEFEHDGSGEKFEDAETWFAKAGFEQSIPLNTAPDLFLKVGVRYTHLGIGETDAPLPDSLQSISAPLTLEWRKETNVPLPKAFIMLQPGVYFSEDIGSNDFDIPAAAAYGFDLSYDLRLYVGAFGGIMSKYGVLPGGGLAWRFHRGGLLSLTFPQGGVFIFPDEKWEIFAGAEWFSLTGRVDRDEELPPALRDGILDYREIRVGLGVKYKPCSWASLGLMGGYTVDRQWDYDRAGYTLEQENAPFAKATFEMRF